VGRHRPTGLTGTLKFARVILPFVWKKPGAQVMAQVSAVAALKAQIGAPF